MSFIEKISAFFQRVLNKTEKEYELKFNQSKKLFELFMENIPYIIIIKDENLRIRYVNSLAKAYSKSVKLGSTTKDNLPEDIGRKVDELARKAQKEGKAEMEIAFENEFGKFIFRTLSFAIPQDDGSIHVGTIYIDITQEKKLSKELGEQKELMIAQSRHAAMGEMISLIAHQWRQPISVIAMDANNILLDIELENVDLEELKTDAQSILSQTQHLSHTIDDFRDFFKPNRERSCVLVSDVLQESLKVIEKSFEYNNITLINSIETATEVEIFSRELLQVLLNILKNAKEVLVETTPQNRMISNRVFEKDEFIIVEISDNGGGVAPENLLKIFDPYFSTKKDKNGTGLGLYMSKVIVEQHLYGTIEVENRGNGACFIVKIPKQRDKQQ